MKDWKGNNKSIYTCHGASNHSKENRQEEDYYATDPSTIDDLLKYESFNNNIWENASGEDHLANRLRDKGYIVRSSDIVKRTPNTEIIDFLNFTGLWEGDIITNPPYKYADSWVYKSLESITTGSKVAMFLKLTFLEGQNRKKLFKKYPPKKVYVYSKRAMCAKNGEFTKYKSNAVAYAWYVWEKGFIGNPEIFWI